MKLIRDLAKGTLSKNVMHTATAFRISILIIYVEVPEALCTYLRSLIVQKQIKC